VGGGEGGVDRGGGGGRPPWGGLHGGGVCKDKHLV